MKKVTENGIWEAYAEDEILRICTSSAFCGDKTIDKADPMPFCERPPGTASILYDIENFPWNDDEAGWPGARKHEPAGYFTRPLRHLRASAESWRRHGDNGCYSRELAEDLAPYVKQMGYTHIGCADNGVPLQPVVGLSDLRVLRAYLRFGTRATSGVIDRMHQAGIGVILDWVPAHF